MSNKFICVLAVIVLAICLLSGGCFSPVDDSNVKAWKDLIKLSPDEEKADEEESKEKVEFPVKPVEFKDSIDIELYFAGPDKECLVMEKRTIEKTEGIARKTMEELIKGPDSPNYARVFAEGSRLLDINITAEGQCIVDLSSEVQNLDNLTQEKLMLYAISNTLGQFSSINNVVFMINGERVDSIAGFIDLSEPITPDYSILK